MMLSSKASQALALGLLFGNSSASFLRTTDQNNRELFECTSGGSTYWPSSDLSTPFSEADASGCIDGTGSNRLKCNSKDANDFTITEAVVAIGGDTCYFCGAPGEQKTGQLQIGIINDTGSTRPTAGFLGQLAGISDVAGGTCPLARCSDVNTAQLPPGEQVFDAGPASFKCGDALEFPAGDFVLFWTDASANSVCTSFDECKDFSPKCKINDAALPVSTGITCKDLGGPTQALCNIPDALSMEDVFNIPAGTACGALTMSVAEPSAGDFCAGGTITRTYTISNDGTPLGDCIEEIQPIDNAPPAGLELGSIADDVSGQCASEAPAQPSGLTVTDDCDGSIAVSVSDVTVPGGCDNRFTVTRTFSATDSCSQTTEVVQTITIFDDQPPTYLVGCPVDDPNACTDTVLLGPAPSYTDNCLGPTVPVCFDSDNSINDVSGLVTIGRGWSADDGCNAPTVCEQSVTIAECTQGNGGTCDAP